MDRSPGVDSENFCEIDSSLKLKLSCCRACAAFSQYWTQFWTNKSGRIQNLCLESRLRARFSLSRIARARTRSLTVHKTRTPTNIFLRSFKFRLCFLEEIRPNFRWVWLDFKGLNYILEVRKFLWEIALQKKGGNLSWSAPVFINNSNIFFAHRN